MNDVILALILAGIGYFVVLPRLKSKLSKMKKEANRKQKQDKSDTIAQ